MTKYLSASEEFVLTRSAAPFQWTRLEVNEWLRWCVKEYGLDEDIPNRFPMNGKGLFMLMKEDFRERAPDIGDVIYNSLHQHKLSTTLSNILKAEHNQPNTTDTTNTMRQQLVTSGGDMSLGNSFRDSSLPRSAEISIGSTNPFALYEDYRNEPHFNSDFCDANSEPLNLTFKVSKSSISPIPSSTLSLSSFYPSTHQTTTYADKRWQPISFQQQSPVLRQMEIQADSFEIDTVSKTEDTFLKCEFQNEQKGHYPQTPTTTTTACDSLGNINFHQTSRMSTSDRLLWKFLAELLDASTTRCISWEDRENLVFRIVDPEGLAFLWGFEKCKKGMTYEKLSRALRYYYKMNIIAKVPGKRLTYQFMTAPHLIKKGKRGARPGLPHKRKNQPDQIQQVSKIERTSDDSLHAIVLDEFLTNSSS